MANDLSLYPDIALHSGDGTATRTLLSPSCLALPWWDSNMHSAVSVFPCIPVTRQQHALCSLRLAWHYGDKTATRILLSPSCLALRWRDSNTNSAVSVLPDITVTRQQHALRCLRLALSCILLTRQQHALCCVRLALPWFPVTGHQHALCCLRLALHYRDETAICTLLSQSCLAFRWRDSNMPSAFSVLPCIPMTRQQHIFCCLWVSPVPVPGSQGGSLYHGQRNCLQRWRVTVNKLNK
jgi:hypothetical protein